MSKLSNFSDKNTFGCVKSALVLSTALLLIMQSAAWAMPAKSMMSFVNSNSSSTSGQEILLDVTMSRVRDTRADGLTDNAGRVSIGGMFSSWLGLDLQGSYFMQSRSYLVGADLRLAPTEWFFLKAGGGGYSSPESRELKATPLGGAGIMARLSRDFYLVTEATYFQIDDRHNVGFGGGLGISF